MDVGIRSLSEFKHSLQTVVQNLKKLDEVNRNGDEISESIMMLITQTNEVLNKLEHSSTTRFSRILKKRKKLRRLKAAKRQREEIKKVKLRQEFDAIEKIHETHSSQTDRNAIKSSKMPHERLTQYNDAKQFFRRFELLKVLHLERSQDQEASDQFNKQFENLEGIWRNILHNNAPERSREDDVEQQWLETFFGAKEQSNVIPGRKLHDFLRIRATWDSYLTKDKQNGSHIPTGWVLPTQQTDARWLPYRRVPPPTNLDDTHSSTSN